MNWQDFDALIDAALEEDAAGRDVTTLALVPGDRSVEAEVVAREDGVVCGLPLAARIAARFDGRLAFEAAAEDGAQVTAGTLVARASGPAAALLAVERTLLNFLQRLSGMATLTARYVAAVSGTHAEIYDTRKTPPGWRLLAKYAVRCGGGRNHRMNLAELALIKDNHLALMGGPMQDAGAVRAAVEKVREADPGLIVEVEVEGTAQLRAALDAGADIILLDNMTPDEFRHAADIVAGTCTPDARPALEASGGITLENVRAYAEAGADRISIGALTHSAPAFDLSLEVVPGR